jgi:hypothetical protein
MTILRLVSVALAGCCLCVAGCGDGSPSTNGTGGTGGIGGMVFEPGPTCIAFCANVVGACQAFVFDEESCRQGCEQNLADERSVSEACEDAAEAVFQCAAELDCQDVYAWRDAEFVPVDDYPCRAEVEAVEAVQEVEPACGQDTQN